MAPDIGVAPVDRNGADQSVTAATKRPQRFRGGGEIRWLIEPMAITFQDLIGADDQGPWDAGGDFSGLGVGQDGGGGFHITVLTTHALFNFHLVNGRGFASVANTGVIQDVAADFAGRSQNDGTHFAPVLENDQSSSSLRRLYS